MASRAPRLQNAHLTEILRAHQKDQTYLDYLTKSAQDAIQAIFGPRLCFAYHKEISLLSYVCYYILTTVSDRQTIGEEYVNIVQVSRSTLPSKIRRFISIVLQCFGPYVVERFTKWYVNKQRLIQGEKITESTGNIIDLTHRIHLGLFYIYGSFYYLSKRIMNIRYVKVRVGSSSGVSLSPLGYLSLVHSLVSLALNFCTIYNVYRQSLIEVVNAGGSSCGTINNGNIETETAQTPSTTYVSARDRCSLCLESRVHPAVTPCGHVFCWQCIHEWCQTKAECPVCRDTFSPSRIVLLLNFDTSV